jgi:hypothetical protein
VLGRRLGAVVELAQREQRVLVLRELDEAVALGEALAAHRVDALLVQHQARGGDLHLGPGSAVGAVCDLLVHLLLRSVVEESAEARLRHALGDVAHREARAVHREVGVRELLLLLLPVAQPLGKVLGRRPLGGRRVREDQALFGQVQIPAAHP